MPSVKVMPLENLDVGDFFRFYMDDTLFLLTFRDECDFRCVEPLTGIECIPQGGGELVVPVEVMILWRDCLDDAEGTEE